nr:tripartite tricarboxylate transporter substrate binding protein [Variibacter gotjawalensis]
MPAAAQTYPNRPITLVVPFAPGSGTDGVARVVMPRIEAALGQTIVIDNKPGATGTIGSAIVARAAPDGYTLLLGGVSSHAASRALLKHVPYDPVKDFVAIAKFGVYPFPYLVPKDLPVKTLSEFVAYTKANAGKVSYAYANAPGRISGEALRRHLGADLTAVPYRASPAAITDLVAGRVQIMVVDHTTALAQLEGGNIRALSTTTQERSALLPGVPGLREQGYGWLELQAWVGLFAPAGTPDAIVQRFRTELSKALAEPDLIAKLAAVGFEAAKEDPAEFPKKLEQDIAIWKQQAEEAGIKPE